jgi:hypothetical protein
MSPGLWVREPGGLRSGRGRRAVATAARRPLIHLKAGGSGIAEGSDLREMEDR